MKKILTLLLLLISLSNLSAQDSTEVKYLVNNPKVSISGFGGILSETSILDHGLSESVGAGGALTITDYFFIGGYGLSLTSNNYISDLIIPQAPPLDSTFMGKKLRTSFSHAGIWVGGILFPKKRVHVGISTRIGWGSVHLEKADVAYVNNANYLLDYTNNKVFVVTPQVELEVNITSWLKVNLGVGYRYVSGISFDRFKSYDFNTPQITFGLYFGGFASKDKDEEETPTTDPDSE